MKQRLLLLTILISSVFNASLAEKPVYIQTSDGVIVFTDSAFTGSSHAVKLEVVADNIIRVISAPGKDILHTQSLVMVYTKKADLIWKLISSGEKLSLKTKALTAIINIKTGAVSFLDA
ncbi:MAG: DUF4968 domain-containing protein, partial [Bacteroidia bacterium]|nr:DUF4968 domain-containing protein [Bacteroidia bacterium]